MIKLTMTPQTQPITYIFEKECILIGEIIDDFVPDFIVSHSGEHSVYVKIELVQENYIASNLAEDPFITINDFPFNKKRLKTGDLLQIGSTEILFGEFISQVSDDEIQPNKNECLDEYLIDILTQKIENISPPSSPELTTSLDIDATMLELEELLEKSNVKQKSLQADNELISSTKESPISDQELEALFSKLDALDLHSPNITRIELHDIEPTPSPHVNEEVKETLSPPLPTSEIKSSNDTIEENILKKESFDQKDKPFFLNWKMFFSFIGIFLLLIGIISGSLYLAITGKNEEEEIKAAQAIADVAMALNSAFINHAQPQNHNWSDPEFLKQTLAAVLAPSYQPLINIDAHGHFKSTSYILRIYTGDDLNHFLIIAQPSPNILQWLIPKAAITVDSSFMELRKITDLKTLNRLLVNAKLDTSNSAEITNLVKLGKLVSLSTLKNYRPHAGFDLPKALALFRPGAENLIYNSIRYYPLGESLIKKATAIYDNDENGHDLIPLIEEISQFTRFPDIVLYSSEGIQMAQRGNKALATFFPHYKFLYAYLQFNQQMFSHTIHLLIDDNEINHVALNSINEQEQPDKLDIDGETQIDKQHPLYYKLIALHNENEKTLRPISNKIEQEKLNKKWDSPRKLSALQINYDNISQKLHKKTMEIINNLQREYFSMPFSQFMNFLKAAKIESHLERNLKELQQHELNASSTVEIKEYIEKIKHSTFLRELDSNLTKAIQLVTLESIPNPADIIALQNEIHSAVVRKLDALILYPVDHVLPQEPEDRNFLIHILKSAWVTDEAEFEYYVHEFDLLPYRES